MKKKYGQEDLRKILVEMDEQDEIAYKKITGSYDYDDFTLIVEYVPEKPGIRPTRIRASVPLDNAKFAGDIFTPKSRELAARDFIARRFAEKTDRYSISVPGVKGGKFSIDRPGQELLEISAVVVGKDSIEVRFIVELPVQKWKVHCQTAVELFLKRIPAIVRECLMFEHLDGEKLTEWIKTNEDADFIRNTLSEKGLVAFIADGSIITKPFSADLKEIIPFTSPEELAVIFELPNRGKVRGMGIPAGITLVTGGCSQGKSTLLRAIELGVYNHIYGDGRELAVTAPDAVGIRVEEGRKVENVDISPLIKHISEKINTRHLSVKSAFPAASFAANIMEALEIGTSLMLFDDETTVSGFMGGDARIQTLIPEEEEILTPLVDFLPMLKDKHGISSIIVGGTGDFFDIADTVIAMRNFRTYAVTGEAQRIARENPSGRIWKNTVQLPPAMRCPLVSYLEPLKTDKTPPTKLHGKRYVQYGDELIDVSKVTQIVNQSQSRGIGRGITLVHRLMEGSKTLKEAVDKVMERIENVGLDTLSNRYMGDLASFRAYELAAAINRMKNLKVK